MKTAWSIFVQLSSIEDIQGCTFINVQKFHNGVSVSINVTTQKHCMDSILQCITMKLLLLQVSAAPWWIWNEMQSFIISVVHLPFHYPVYPHPNLIIFRVTEEHKLVEYTKHLNRPAACYSITGNYLFSTTQETKKVDNAEACYTRFINSS